MKKADNKNNYMLIAGGVLLSAAIIFMLFGSGITTNLTTGSLVQAGNRIDTYATYNGRCGHDTSNSMYFLVNGANYRSGTLQVPCSASDGQQYLKDAVLTYAAGSVYDTIYFNNILYQAPAYNPDLPAKAYLTDVSPVGSTNINAITNVPINVLLTLKTVQQDTIAKDGSMTTGWYKITVFDSFMNPIKDLAWVQMPEPYVATKTIEFGFNPTYEATYYISLVGVKQNYTFAGGKWTVTEAFDSRDLKQITSKGSFPTPTQTPVITPATTPVTTPVVTATHTPIIPPPPSSGGNKNIIIMGAAGILITIVFFTMRRN